VNLWGNVRLGEAPGDREIGQMVVGSRRPRAGPDGRRLPNR
jgi:hypothetical protein